MDAEKKCSKCGEVKPLSEFYNAGYKGRSTLKAACIPCTHVSRNKAKSSSPAAYLHHLYIQQKSKHRNSNFPYSITEEDLLNLWEAQNGKCALSGVHMTYEKDGKGRKDFNASVDRFNTEAGYVPGNVQLVCDRVNTMRHTLSVDMFKWWVKCIYDASCD